MENIFGKTNNCNWVRQGEFFFILPLKIKRDKAIVCLLMLHRGFCNLPEHATRGHIRIFKCILTLVSCMKMCVFEREAN